MAYAQLRQLFHQDGSPLHYHVSYLGIADLAAAAVRADRQLEGRDIVERALAQLDGDPSPRLEQLTARAPACSPRHQGPERTSRRRCQTRPETAGPSSVPSSSLTTPNGCAANAGSMTLNRSSSPHGGIRGPPYVWAQRAGTELRACGVGLPDVPGAPDALSELTPQQREIIRLAGNALTDREIAERLFLSPRTVSSLLIAPIKAGIAGDARCAR